MNGDITVPIVTYNHRRYLADALDGVFAQTLRPDVITVTDDCSPDDDEAALAAIVAGYSGVTFTRSPINLGAVAQFRSVIRAVSTPYYMLHAADDVLVDPTFLENAFSYLESHKGVVAVYGRTIKVDAIRQPVENEVKTRTGQFHLLSGRRLRSRLARANIVPAVCVVVRASVHDLLPPFPLDNPLCHDWQQWYLMSYFGDFALLDRTVMQYRVHGSNLSMGTDQRRRVEAAWLDAYRELIAHPLVHGEDRLRLQLGLTHQRAKPLRPYRLMSRVATRALGLAKGTIVR